MTRNSRSKIVTIDCAKCPLRRDAALAPELQRGLKLIRKSRLEMRVLPPGTQICTEGEPSDEVFTLFTGWAFRYKLLHGGRRQILNFRLPGDFFGCGLEGSQGFDHSVESITHVVLCVFNKEQFDTAVQSDPALAALARRIVRSEEGAVFEHLVDVGRRNSLEAVGHLLLELYLRQRRGGKSKDHSCRFPITQVLLADALGLTAAHVNRVLRQLREGGLASISGQNLVIHDVDRLTELCEFRKDYTSQVPVI
jgi:CRP/FNR family transcriptional regulator